MSTKTYTKAQTNCQSIIAGSIKLHFFCSFCRRHFVRCQNTFDNTKAVRERARDKERMFSRKFTIDNGKPRDLQIRHIAVHVVRLFHAIS